MRNSGLIIILLALSSVTASAQFLKSSVTLYAGFHGDGNGGYADFYEGHRLYLDQETKNISWDVYGEFARKISRKKWSTAALYLFARPGVTSNSYSGSGTMYPTGTGVSFRSRLSGINSMTPAGLRMTLRPLHYNNTFTVVVDGGVRFRYSFNAKLNEQWVSASDGDLISYSGNPFVGKNLFGTDGMFGFGMSGRHLIVMFNLFFKMSSAPLTRPAAYKPGYYSYFYDHVSTYPMEQVSICIGYIF